MSFIVFEVQGKCSILYKTNAFNISVLSTFKSVF